MHAAKNRGHARPCPSGAIANRRHPAAFASPGGTASSRSASKARHRGPCRTCGATQSASALASPVRFGEGRRLRRPREYRAQGTVPLPQGRMGGTASPRSASKGRHRGPCRTCSGTQSASALASPIRSARDGFPAVRKNIGRRGLCPSHKAPWEGPRPRGPLGCAHNGLLLPSRCPGHPAPCSGKRLRNALPDTNGRHGDRDMLCGLSFGRSPCPLCLCGLLLRAFVVGWQRRRFLRSQFFC
jgi:hypothetical protein